MRTIDAEAVLAPALATTASARFEAAYGAHWREVVGFALAWTNDWAAAQDLTQDAYLRLWGQRDRLDWERPLLPWLLVTVRNLATDRFRALQRRVWFPAPRTGLDETALALWLDVQAALAVLTPLERTALVLTAVEGYASADAARALGVSAGAVRAAVSRARDKLEVSKW